MVTLLMTLFDRERSTSRPQHVWGSLSRKQSEIQTQLHVQCSTYRKWHLGYRTVTFRMTSRNLTGQGRASDILGCKHLFPCPFPIPCPLSPPYVLPNHFLYPLSLSSYLHLPSFSTLLSFHTPSLLRPLLLTCASPPPVTSFLTPFPSL